MRTHEQVVADVERRFKELKEEKRKHDEEMAKPKYTKPCNTCRHCKGAHFCTNPLVKGIGPRVQFKNLCSLPSESLEKLSVCKGADRWSSGKVQTLNNEQALWEPRLKWWQKLFNRMINKGDYVT